MSVNYDSILIAQDTNVINTSTFYKTGKELPDHGIPMAELSYTVSHDDYILCSMLLLTLTIAILLYRGRTTICFRLKEFFTTKRSYSQENVNSNNREVYSTFFLTSISAISLTLILFNLAAKEIGFDSIVGIPYWFFAAGYAAIVGFIYLKAWLYALINWTFFHREANNRWTSGYLLLTSVLAFILSPLSIVCTLIENSHKIVIQILLVVLFLYELLLFCKLLVNFGGKIYGYLLLFLYFCTLEVMPVLILYRIVTWILNNFIVKYCIDGY